MPPPLPARPGAARPAAGAAQRSALHLQAPVGSSTCGAAARRRAGEGSRRMKIAKIDSISVKVPFTFGGAPTGYGGAQLDDQQHPAGQGRDRHRHHRLGRGLLLRLHRRGEGGAAVDDRADRDRPRCARHREAVARSAAGAPSVRPLRHHDLRPVGPRHRALGHRRQGSQPAAASAAGRRRADLVAGLCEPAEVPRSRARCRAHQAGDPAGLPVHQAARDRGSRGPRRARGRGPRRDDHGRHQLPVDAGRGAAHDAEAPALRPALARGADLPAGGLRGDRPAARRHRRRHGGGREQLHVVPVPRHVRGQRRRLRAAQRHQGRRRHRIPEGRRHSPMPPA